ncbi:MAG: outer membrane protein assembly factor BamA [Phycisphaerae bacterium]|nr:outer membrane protein assembly factor BamA [Phycisphaerae bacterium]
MPDFSIPSSARDRRCIRASHPGFQAVRGLLLVVGLTAGVPLRAQEVPPAPPPPAAPPEAETSPYEGRLVKAVEFEGLKRVGESYLMNQLRTAPGQPLSWSTVREDLRRMERLGEFRDIRANILVDADLNVIVHFTVVEAPLVKDVIVVGNRQVTDQDVMQVVQSNISLTKGIPIDDYQIGRAQRAIEDLYRNKGYYLAQVTIDESELASEGNIIFRVREGERVKVTAIRFEGNTSFTPRQVRSAIKTTEAWFFDKGVIDDTVLDADVAAIVKFYLDRGYLDVRASRRVQPSPDGREAIITFFIEEGALYTLREVSFVNASRRASKDGADNLPKIMSIEQVRGLMEVKPGNTVSQSAVDRSVKAVRDAYRKMGYVDAEVRVLTLRVPDESAVDMELTVIEGERFKTGMVYIQGNDLTQQKVIRREVQIDPDRWLDGTATDDTQKRLRDMRLFKPEEVKVTIQPEDPKSPGYRDVLVQVQETDTGSLGFGVAVGSDAGLAGVVNLNQRNFDIADTPDSFDEFIRGRAFRGAGQTFNIAVQPGTETQNYEMSLLEPYLLDTPTSLFSSLYFRTREFREYDEERLGTRLRLGRRFGTRWAGGLAFRIESIDISNIDDNAATDLFDVEGQNYITSVSPDITRTTVDSRFRPTKGTYTQFGIEQVGALGGDFSFTKLNAEHQVFFAIDEDFFGNKTVVSFKGRVGYIPQDDEAPIFERYFLGGRSFRGFRFRGIGPLGVDTNGNETDDHVGGDFLFFFGTEVERPLWKEVVSGVAFIDSGTIADEASFDDYKVSVGLGLRLYIPQLGSAPLAFDFGFPLNAIDRDREQIFSFSVDLPIR